jgi:hypothetical protein
VKTNPGITMSEGDLEKTKEIVLLHPAGQHIFTMYNDGFWKIDEDVQNYRAETYSVPRRSD